MIIQHKPITSQEQYYKVAYRIEQLKNAEPATLAAKELKLMTTLILEYEMERLRLCQAKTQLKFESLLTQNKEGYQ